MFFNKKNYFWKIKFLAKTLVFCFNCLASGDPYILPSGLSDIVGSINPSALFDGRNILEKRIRKENPYDNSNEGLLKSLENDKNASTILSSVQDYLENNKDAKYGFFPYIAIKVEDNIEEIKKRNVILENNFEFLEKNPGTDEEQKKLRNVEKENINKQIKDNKERIAKDIKDLEEIRADKLAEFDKQVLNIEKCLTENKLENKDMFGFLKSMIFVIASSSLEEIKEVIDKEDKDKISSDNKLHEKQLKFIDTMKKICDSSDLDAIISYIMKDDRMEFSQYLFLAVYNPSWNEELHLQFIDYIEQIKKSVIRGGGGYVQGGVADARGAMPITQYRFSNRYGVAKNRNAFTYGTEDREGKWEQRKDPYKDFDKRIYPDEFKINEKGHFKISKKVIKKMKECDREATSPENYYDISYYKGNFAQTRKIIADIFQFFYFGPRLMLHIIRHGNWDQLLSLPLIAVKWTLALSVYVLLYPVQTFDYILYYA